MTRRIKRQRHRRRRGPQNDYDSVDSATDTVLDDTGSDDAGLDDTSLDDTGLDDTESEDSEPDEVVTADFEMGDDEPEREPEVVAVADQSQVKEVLVNEDLEDTAADPVLGAAAVSNAQPLRQRVDRPDTDGAPMLVEPQGAPEDPDHPEAFGRWLRSQRELRGIRLRAIADTSKISLGHLKALEEGRFDLLPAEVFTKGFLRQYAGFVGLDPEETINFYLAARDHVDEEEDPLGLPNPPKEASGARWVLVALILVAVLLGLIWGLSRLSVSAEGDGGQTTPSGPISRDSSMVDAPGDDGTESDREPDAGTDLATDSASSTMSSPGESTDPATDPASATLAPPSPLTQAPQTALPVGVPLRVVLDFSDTCWVSALIDGGETREKVHAQGESLTLDAQSSVELKVGNFRAVEVEVNGMPYDLGSQGRTGSVVRTVLIDLDTVRALRGAV